MIFFFWQAFVGFSFSILFGYFKRTFAILLVTTVGIHTQKLSSSQFLRFRLLKILTGCFYSKVFSFFKLIKKKGENVERGTNSSCPGSNILKYSMESLPNIVADVNNFLIDSSILVMRRNRKKTNFFL